MTQRGIIIDLEICGQDTFTYHLAEGLTTGFHAMTFHAMSEDLMEENTTGRTAHDGRTCERIGNGRLDQRFEATS